MEELDFGETIQHIYIFLATNENISSLIPNILEQLYLKPNMLLVIFHSTSLRYTKHATHYAVLMPTFRIGKGTIAHKLLHDVRNFMAYSCKRTAKVNKNKNSTKSSMIPTFTRRKLAEAINKMYKTLHPNRRVSKKPELHN